MFAVRPLFPGRRSSGLVSAAARAGGLVRGRNQGLEGGVRRRLHLRRPFVQPAALRHELGAHAADRREARARPSAGGGPGLALARLPAHPERDRAARASPADRGLRRSRVRGRLRGRASLGSADPRVRPGDPPARARDRRPADRLRQRCPRAPRPGRRDGRGAGRARPDPSPAFDERLPRDRERRPHADSGRGHAGVEVSDVRLQGSHPLPLGGGHAQIVLPPRARPPRGGTRGGRAGPGGHEGERGVGPLRPLAGDRAGRRVRLLVLGRRPRRETRSRGRDARRSFRVRRPSRKTRPPVGREPVFLREFPGEGGGRQARRATGGLGLQHGSLPPLRRRPGPERRTIRQHLQSREPGQAGLPLRRDEAARSLHKTSICSPSVRGIFPTRRKPRWE